MKEFGKFLFVLMMMFKMLEKGSFIYMYICCVLGNKKSIRECNESIEYLEILVEDFFEKIEKVFECVFCMDFDEKMYYDIFIGNY